MNRMHKYWTVSYPQEAAKTQCECHEENYQKIVIRLRDQGELNARAWEQLW